VEPAQVVAESLQQIVVKITAACEEKRPEIIRSGALQLLATMGPLRGSTPHDLHLSTAWRSDMAPKTRTALWLIDASAHSILEHLGEDGSRDWAGVGAASSFAESGIDQLQEELVGS
jgi:hypothetical protein